MRRALTIILASALLAACGSQSNPSAVLCQHLHAQAARFAKNFLSPMDLRGAAYQKFAARLTADQLSTLSAQHHVICP